MAANYTPVPNDLEILYNLPDEELDDGLSPAPDPPESVRPNLHPQDALQPFLARPSTSISRDSSSLNLPRDDVSALSADSVRPAVHPYGAFREEISDEGAEEDFVRDEVRESVGLAMHSLRSSAASDNERDRFRATHSTHLVQSPGLAELKDRRRKRSPRFSFFNGCNEWWLWEIGGWLLSFLALVGLVVLLIEFDGRALSRWRSNITLNAIISILTTTAKAALLIPLGEGISQLKWHWFGSRRALDGMEVFDRASRGPRGSVHLLFRTRGRQLASLGALVTIFALGIGPFTQQIVTYPIRQVSSGSATVGRVQSYNSASLQSSRLSQNLDLPTKAAIYEGFFAVPDQITPSCPTGNCTWPTFTSLAVCNKCIDATSFIQNSCADNGSPVNSADGCIYTLPNGLSYDEVPGQPGFSLVAAGELLVPEIGSTENTLANFSVLGYNQAFECSLFWCVQQYNATVTDGTYNESVLKIFSNDTLNRLDVTSDGGNDTVLSVPINASIGGNTTFTISQGYVNGLQRFLEPFLSGEISQTNDTDLNFSSDAMEALVAPNATGSFALVDIPQLINNLTQSMTVQLRQSAPSEDQIIGTAWTSEAYIHVRWGWIALPLSLLVLTLLFLVAVIISTAQSPVKPWKSSTTALLFFGLSEENRVMADRIEKRMELDAIARSTNVELVKSDTGWRLM